MIAVALVALAAAPAELTLEQALQRTAQAQPLLRAAQARKQTALHQVDLARSALLPQVSAQGQGFISTSNNAPIAYLSPTDIARVGSRPADYASDSVWVPYGSELLGIGAHQTVLDFNAFGQLAAAEANHEAAAAGLTLTLQQLLLRTAEAYYRAVAAEEELSVANAALERAKTQRAEAEAGVKSGLKPAIDAARAMANEAAAELRVHEATGMADVTRGALAFAMGSQPLPADARLVRPNVDAATVAPASSVERPDVVVLRAEERAARARARAALGTGLPKVLVTSSISLRGFASAPTVPNYDVGLLVQVPIYFGGGPTAAAAAEQSRAEELEAREQSVTDAIAYQVLEADRLLTASTRGLEAAERQREAAQAGLQQAEARYKIGLGTIVELVDAQTQLATAEQAVVRGRLNIGLSQARLLYARGEMSAPP